MPDLFVKTPNAPALTVPLSFRQIVSFKNMIQPCKTPPARKISGDLHGLKSEKNSGIHQVQPLPVILHFPTIFCRMNICRAVNFSPVAGHLATSCAIDQWPEVGTWRDVQFSPTPINTIALTDRPNPNLEDAELGRIIANGLAGGQFLSERLSPPTVNIFSPEHCLTILAKVRMGKLI